MDGSACARCRREKRARGEPIFARKPQGAAGQNRGAPAILDGRQSPRRHAMAMLISLSHRDEREISVLPPNPFRAFGVNSKTLQMPAARPHGRAGVRQTVQAGGPPWPLPTARSASKRRTPCRSMSVGPQGPVRQHGRGTATEPEARVPAAQGGKPRTRRSAPAGRAGPSAPFLTGPLNLKWLPWAAYCIAGGKYRHGVRRPDATLLRDR